MDDPFQTILTFKKIYINIFNPVQILPISQYMTMNWNVGLIL